MFFFSDVGAECCGHCLAVTRRCVRRVCRCGTLPIAPRTMHIFACFGVGVSGPVACLTGCVTGCLDHTGCDSAFQWRVLLTVTSTVVSLSLWGPGSTTIPRSPIVWIENRRLHSRGVVPAGLGGYLGNATVNATIHQVPETPSGATITAAVMTDMDGDKDLDITVVYSTDLGGYSVRAVPMRNGECDRLSVPGLSVTA